MVAVVGEKAVHCFPHVPSIIIYSDRQMHDMKSFCFRVPKATYRSVLGFDKTYNLGAIYVTPSIYKNPALIRCRTGDHQLFLGPIFIHGHSDFDTYSYFFRIYHLVSFTANANN